MYSLLRPLLFALDPETAHDLVMKGLSQRWAAGLAGVAPAVNDHRLAQNVLGRTFVNPVGLAAGLDKQGTAVPAWERLGFGSAEVGTVTPRPQPGNARPRLFRLPGDEALINRFGFNSQGARQVATNLAHRTPLQRMRLGINIGKNKDTPNEAAAEDYAACVDHLTSVADYFVINVSSPNTSGLRDLQQAHALSELVAAVVRRVGAAGSGRVIPVLVKLSPDMRDEELLDAVDASIESGASGIIATNTTLSRSGLASPSSLVDQTGGLSGAPLRNRANAVCRLLFTHVGRRIPLIGVGGIDSPEAAYERVRSGATLLQIYTALIYRGPTLIHDISEGLLRLLERDGFAHIEEAIGIDAH